MFNQNVPKREIHVLYGQVSMYNDIHDTSSEYYIQNERFI